MPNGKPRIIVVLLHKNGENKVVFQNNKFILLADEGGMLPYLGPELSIAKGFLIIKYQYTRSTLSYTFEYDTNQMLIRKAEKKGTSGGLYEDFVYDFVKTLIIEKKKNGEYGKWYTKYLKIKEKAKSLSEFEHAYDWELAENHYL